MNTNKYRVMIVEDEVLLRDGIARKIEALSPEFSIVGTAADGAEALTILNKCNPNIIITDIVMPVMNGLDFIKKAIEINSHVQFVVLSGYSDFAYAKNAMQYGVRDYLLKPLSEEVLQDLFLRITRDIDHNMDTVSTYIHSLLNNPLIPGIDEFYRNTTFYAVMIFMGNYVSHRFNHESEEFFDSFWQAIDICGISSQIGAEFGNPYLYCSTYPNERILIFTNPNFSSASLKQYADKLFTHLNTAPSNLPISICYGESTVAPRSLYTTVKMLRKLYYFNYRPWKPQCFCLSGDNEHMFSNKSVGAVKIDNIIQHFQSGRIRAARQGLSSALQSWVQSELNLDRFFNNLQFLLYSLRRCIPQTCESLWDDLCRDIYLCLAISNKFSSFFNELYDLLEKYFTLHGEDVNARNLMGKVKMFIDENFNQPITIFDIANRFHISSSHLSRMFKYVYGQSPINYLISLRIREACELMQQCPDLDFKNISELIGYNDQHYFSKLFKKHTGSTPTDYRNSRYHN